MKVIFPLIALLGSLSFVGCASVTSMAPELPKEQIIEMAKQGQSDDVILKKIDSTDSVYNLTADDVVGLRQAGVSDKVVTYMMRTREREGIEQARRTYETTPSPSSIVYPR